MAQVNLHEAKTHLSRLVEQAAKGEEIVIAKAGRPVAKLVPISTPGARKRKPGALKGKIKLHPGWDAPLAIVLAEEAQWDRTDVLDEAEALRKALKVKAKLKIADLLAEGRL